jgi:hypothetical protein
MVRPIDGVAAIQQPLRVQEQLHSPLRQSQIPHEAQERSAAKKQAELAQQVQQDEAALGKGIRDEDPRKNRRQARREKDKAEEPTDDGQPHIDLVV